MHYQPRWQYNKTLKSKIKPVIRQTAVIHHLKKKKMPIEMFDFAALVCFIIASLLGLKRAFLEFNFDYYLNGKKEISFTKYFLRHIDSSVMNIFPITVKYADENAEIKRKKTNRVTYHIYILYILAIGLYILRLTL